MAYGKVVIRELLIVNPSGGGIRRAMGLMLRQMAVDLSAIPILAIGFKDGRIVPIPLV